jgi:hypothetical protein
MSLVLSRRTALLLPVCAAAFAGLAAVPADAGQGGGQRSGVYRYVVLWQGGGQQWRGGAPGGWRPWMQGGRPWRGRYGWNQPGPDWPGQGWPGRGEPWRPGPWKPGPWKPSPGHGPGGPGHAGPPGGPPGPFPGPRPPGGGPNPPGIGVGGGPGTSRPPARAPLGVCGFGGACPVYGLR